MKVGYFNVQFVNRLSKSTELYKLIATKFEEYVNDFKATNNLLDISAIY